MRLFVMALSLSLTLIGTSVLSPPSATAAPASRLSRGINAFGLKVYKAVRKKPGNVLISPWSLHTAMGLATVGATGRTRRALTRALGIRFFSVEKFEADDVIAALVRRLEAIPTTIWIVTRDKDLGALASERVGLLDPSGRQRQGPAEIEARFGVPPALLQDYLALVGDPTDRIPGVRGIGPFTARALLRHFGGVDGIPPDEHGWEGIDLPQPERVRRYLEEGREALELSRELVRLRDDLPIDAELADLRYRGASRSKLAPLLERLGFTRLLRQVPVWSD